MYDKALVLDILEQITDAIETVKKRCACVGSVNDFMDSDEGQEKLDGICMKLIAVGESLKNIDKITNRALLNSYPNVEWKKIKGIRDFISHHYFDLDAEIIFGICKNHIDVLLAALKQIKIDLQ
jgi:uncharacterized protein with HEPN domain